jgi:alpha-L-fucosidase 2
MTADNLFDLHPPLGLTVNESEVFQIDGNFGAAAGIGMMLVQSIKDEIRLLPALPKEWSKGSIKGLRAYNGFEIDLVWEDGKLSEAVLYSSAGSKAKLKCVRPLEITSRGASVEYLIDQHGCVVFDTTAGGSYSIRTLKE